jgi:hypothetical protein
MFVHGGPAEADTGRRASSCDERRRSPLPRWRPRRPQQCRSSSCPNSSLISGVRTQQLGPKLSSAFERHMREAGTQQHTCRHGLNVRFSVHQHDLSQVSFEVAPELRSPLLRVSQIRAELCTQRFPRHRRRPLQVRVAAPHICHHLPPACRTPRRREPITNAVQPLTAAARPVPPAVGRHLVGHWRHRGPGCAHITRPFLERATARLAERPESEFPEIAAWRRAFSQMGLKPTQYRCASEALLRRFRKVGSLPWIHPLVDVCNAVSLAYAIPIACSTSTR